MKSGFTAISTEYVDFPSQRRTLRWPLIVLAICVIAPASLFLHDYRLETLKVPYPNFVGVPNWVKFVNEVVRLFTLAALAGRRSRGFGMFRKPLLQPESICS